MADGEVLDDGTGVLGGGRKDRPRNTRRQDETFQVTEHNVDEVKDHVRDNPDQVDAVLKAEKAGDNRKTLVEWLEGQKDDSGLL